MTERGEGWRIEAEASPLEGDALEERLTEQVEEGVAGINSELAQTCEEMCTTSSHDQPHAACTQSINCFKGLGQLPEAIQ